ncbi:hypothetical protein ZEAMMB73_Zm00001d033829 [Zea mays]|uniref:Uncharacterized protein n=1 Tax=Zea mays TaxID=4577 RepID=A0A1D6L2P9_MAIZE|nr:hypothetical protein ZEAMMB73_Zm00001d033829 [Zea mays]
MSAGSSSNCLNPVTSSTGNPTSRTSAIRSRRHWPCACSSPTPTRRTPDPCSPTPYSTPCATPTRTAPRWRTRARSCGASCPTSGLWPARCGRPASTTMTSSLARRRSGHFGLFETSLTETYQTGLSRNGSAGLIPATAQAPITSAPALKPTPGSGRWWGRARRRQLGLPASARGGQGRLRREGPPLLALILMLCRCLCDLFLYAFSG